MKILTILLISLILLSCSSIDKSKPYAVVYANVQKKRTLYTIENNNRLYRIISDNGKIKGDTIKFKNQLTNIK